MYQPSPCRGARYVRPYMIYADHVQFIIDKFLTQAPSAYFLISHGSRDPRSHQGLETCAALVIQCLANPTPMVGTGVLEFGDRPLGIQIADFARAAAIFSGG